jgi:hypothetical protein
VGAIGSAGFGDGAVLSSIKPWYKFVLGLAR